MQKFVCTSIRPSQLPYQELYDWDGAAEFVADYLEFAALDPPYELVQTFDLSKLKIDSLALKCPQVLFPLLTNLVLFFQPTKLFSSPTVLKNQKGHCFEHSTLLCSLLIGSGYDAYVVSGYATRETCLKDETREICPLLRKKEEVRSSCVRSREFSAGYLLLLKESVGAIHFVQRCTLENENFRLYMLSGKSRSSS